MTDTLPAIEPYTAAVDPAGQQRFNEALIRQFRANRGWVGGQLAALPLLLLETIGVKSGAHRIAPLVYVRDGGRYLVIASKAGAPTDPAWYRNLVAVPTATVEVGTERLEVRARVAAGEERDRLFRKAADQVPLFDDYQRRTARRIPVVILEPTAMHTTHHVFEIAAPRERVFEAVTTAAGLAGWWTTKVRSEEARVGTVVEFTFRGPFAPRFEVTELEPPAHLAWKGVGGHGAWGESSIRFDLEPSDGGTRVRFWHWLSPQGGEEAAATANFNWGYYLNSLRQLCEGGRGTPFASETQGARVGAAPHVDIAPGQARAGRPRRPTRPQ